MVIKLIISVYYDYTSMIDKIIFLFFRPWYKSDGSVAGYVQNYKRGVTWVLVLAAGHMVPQNQPDSALQMIKMVIDIKT